MDENTSGDPISLLKWTNKSTYKIADELKKLEHKIDPGTVGRILKENDYSLQTNKKNIEGSSVPERDTQFRYVNEQAKEFTNQMYPVISFDAKKKENVGNFKNSGRTWTKKGFTVASRLDEKEYAKGVKISDEDTAKLRIEYHSLHPKWNYSILPNGD